MAAGTFTEPEVWQESTIPVAGNLQDIAALAPDDVWVTGQRADQPNVGLAAHWDGKSWSSYPISNIPPGAFALTKISAPAPDDVWALGQYTDIGHRDYSGADYGTPLALDPITAHWDGTTWKFMPSPKVAGAGIEWKLMPSPEVVARAGTEWVILDDIAAVGANDVWTAGHLSRKDKSGAWEVRPLLLHWDGKGWTRAALPADAQQGQLGHIAAVSKNDIWAVGDDDKGGLYLHWDGSAWARKPNAEEQAKMPRVPEQLSNAAALPSGNVWLVKSSRYIGGYDRSFASAIHWNGKSWNTPFEAHTQSPPDHGFFFLTSIDGKSRDSVWAVGVNQGEHVIMRWDGSSWKITSCPGHRGTGRLTSVAVLSPNEILAVGSGGMFLRYSPGSCP